MKAFTYGSFTWRFFVENWHGWSLCIWKWHPHLLRCMMPSLNTANLGSLWSKMGIGKNFCPSTVQNLYETYVCSLVEVRLHLAFKNIWKIFKCFTQLCDVHRWSIFKTLYNLSGCIFFTGCILGTKQGSNHKERTKTLWG